MSHAPGSPPTKVEVTFIETAPQAPILTKNSFTRKYAKSRGGAKPVKKEQKFDMTIYANQVKAVVDPIFTAKSNASGLSHLSASILFYPKENGEITNIKVLESSGNKKFDKLCVDSLMEVGFIPPPPARITTEGIVWIFGN